MPNCRSGRALVLLLLHLGLCLAVKKFNSYFIDFQSYSGKSIRAKLDFASPDILVARTGYPCSDASECRLVDPSFQEGLIHDRQYTYQTAVIDFGFRIEDNEGTIRIPLRVRMTDLPFSVFGVHPDAAYRDALFPQQALRFSSADHTALASKRRQTDVSLDFHVASGTYFINAQLLYNIKSKRTVGVANLCFMDRTFGGASNYFLMGNENFQDDWRRFRKSDFDLDGFTAAVVFAEPDKSNFRLPYDLGIFTAYDLDPFKFFIQKRSDFCELFAGDYFLQRGAVEFVVEHRGGQLVAYIAATETPYSRSVMHRWQFFVRVVFWGSVLVAAILLTANCLFPLTKRRLHKESTEISAPMLIN